MTETQAQAVFLAAGYTLNLNPKYVKVHEYKSANGRIAYLRLGQGFPGHADVVTDPRIDPAPLLAIAGVQPNRRVVYRRGTNMTAFPKQENDKGQWQHHGYALQATTEAALLQLCRTYATMP